MSKEQFEQEYDLEKLQIITPRERDFQMLVTPGFYVNWYGCNLFEDFTSALLLNFSKGNMLFIDIGAHYGYYTALVGTKYPDCKIIAFEPVPENFEILKRNAALNHLRNVELHNLAASNSDELRKFHVTEMSSRSSLYQQPWENPQKEIEVQTVCLDNILKKSPKVPTIIKIDTEGHEPYVLQGMKKLLRDSENVKLIIEFNPKCLRSAGYKPENLLEEVSQLGFDIYAIDDNKRMTYKLEKDGLDKWVSYLPEQDENQVTNLLCIRKKNSLSVCFFSHSAQLDGAGRSLLDLTRQLVNRNIVCSVILPGEGPLKGRLDELGASSLIIDYQWWCSVGMLPDDEIKVRLTNSFENVLNILADLSKINPDIIFTNTVLIPWGALVGSLLGKPHVWFIHEFGELKFHLPFKTVGRFIENFSNLTLVSSNALENSLLATLHSKRIRTLKDNITDEKTAKVVVELLRKLKSKANPSLDNLSQFAAQAIVAILKTKDRQIAELNLTLKTKVSSLETSLREKVAQLHRRESQIRRLESRIRRLDARMQQIQRSIPMQLVNRYQRIAEKLLRRGTRRRHYYELGLSGIRVILNEGWKSFFRKAWNRLARRPAQ